LIPGFYGAIFSLEWKDALRKRFCMAAPRRQKQANWRPVGIAVSKDGALLLK
jgi:hypothetical protein